MRLLNTLTVSLISLSLVLPTSPVEAVQFVKQFDAIFGSPSDDNFTNAHEFSDGSMLLVGTTRASSNDSAYLVRIDAEGKLLWEREHSYLGLTDRWERGGPITPTPDGNFLIAGRVSPGPAGGIDFWVFKINADGDKLWERTYFTGSGASTDLGGRLHPLADGTYIAAGTTNTGVGARNDGWALRIDGDGNLLWARSYPALGIGDGVPDTWEAVNTSLLLPNGNLMVSGVTYSRPYPYTIGYGDRVFLLEIDSETGDRVNDTLVGRGNALGMVQTPDGGFLITGYSAGDGMLLKTDAQGNLEWRKSFGGPYFDVLIGLIATSDGGYASGGYNVVDKPGGGVAEKAWVMKFDADGNAVAEWINGPNVGRWANTLGLVELSDNTLLALGNYDAIPLPPGGVGIGGFDAQAVKLALIPDPGTISGTIFQDATDSCVVDTTADGLTNVQVRLQNEDTGAVFQTFTRFGGDYEALVPPGEYSVSMVEDPTTRDTCEPTLVRAASLGEGGIQDDRDFSAQKAGCAPTIMMTGTAPSPSNACGYTPYEGCLGTPQTTPCGGHPWTYCATIGNDGSAAWPANTVDLTLDIAGAEYCGTPDSITCSGTLGNSGNPVNIDLVPVAGSGGLSFTNTNPFVGGGSCQVCVTVDYPASAPGTINFLSATAELNAANCDYVFDSDGAEESCSCDPNDLTVWPAGCGDEGNIRPQPLKFRVRFENTGAGTARNIFIRNPIDPSLDLSTLRIREASHDITRVQIEDGVLVMHFDEILLASPDTTPGNEDINKGFVFYTIAPYAALPEGAAIDNTAYIYFDENPPVVTNTTRNTLVENPDVTADFRFSTEGTAYNFTSEEGADVTHRWSFGGQSFSDAANPSGIVMGDDRLVSHFVSDGICVAFTTRDLLAPPEVDCERFTVEAWAPPMGGVHKVGSTVPVKTTVLLDGQPLRKQSDIAAAMEALGMEADCLRIAVVSDDSGDEVEVPADATGPQGVGGTCFDMQGGAHFNLKLDPQRFTSDATYNVAAELGVCRYQPDNGSFTTR